MNEQGLAQQATDALTAEVNHQRQQMEAILAVATPNFDIDNTPEEVAPNTLFDSMSRRGQMVAVTGLMEEEVQSLYQQMRPYIVTIQQSGT